MLFKLLNVFLVLSITTLLTSCFTKIFSGSIQEIQMKVMDSKSNLIEGVRCVLRAPSGASYFLSSNPGAVTVQRALGPLSVNCKKTGYEQLDVMVGEGFNNVSLLNVFSLPGFAVDVVAYKQNPSYYVVTMEKSGSK